MSVHMRILLNFQSKKKEEEIISRIIIDKGNLQNKCSTRSNSYSYLTLLIVSLIVKWSIRSKHIIFLFIFFTCSFVTQNVWNVFSFDCVWWMALPSYSSSSSSSLVSFLLHFLVFIDGFRFVCVCLCVCFPRSLSSNHLHC